MTEATGSSELVERLRGRARFCRDRREIKSPDVMEEAADRIAELEARLARAEEAVERIGAAIEKAIWADSEVYWSLENGRPFPAETRDALARAALKEQDNG